MARQQRDGGGRAAGGRAVARALATRAALLALLLGGPAARAGSEADLLRLLEQRRCRDCQLQDADLVMADLRDADLRGARLQRANLSQARLDGAQLAGADLSFTSLQGASLRGADLRGVRLEGTDLRQSDLSGARLDPGALGRCHWQQARGIAPDQLSYADLHNAGVEAAEQGRMPEAEQFFGEAIRRQPEAAISWVARGISRSEQGKQSPAASDLNYAAQLYDARGDAQQAQQLRQAAAALAAPGEKPRSGNGLGGQLLGGAVGLFQNLAPLALKYLAPLAF